MKDNGGTTNGGVDSFTNSFTLGVYWIKYAPTIIGLTNRTIRENDTTEPHDALHHR